MAACASGLLEALVELWLVRTKEVSAFLEASGQGGRVAQESVWWASRNGHVKVVEWLLEQVGAPADAVRLGDGSTALIAAAQDGHLEVVQALVGAGANIDQARVDGVTPLLVAVDEGHDEVVEALRAAGAGSALGAAPSTPVFGASVPSSGASPGLGASFGAPAVEDSEKEQKKQVELLQARVAQLEALLVEKGIEVPGPSDLVISEVCAVRRGHYPL